MTEKQKVVVSITREGELFRGIVRKKGHVIASATRHTRYGPCGIVAYCQRVAMEHNDWVIEDWVLAPGI